MSKERPILMSGAMVRAVLEGSKTQTRRVVKFDQLAGKYYEGGAAGIEFDGFRIPRDCGPAPARFSAEVVGGGAYVSEELACPYGQPGDRLVPAMYLPGYDKRYCVDVFGNVWSRAKSDWKRLKPGITSKGYCTITPARNGRYATQLVHRLICEAFYGPAPDGLEQVRHLNGNQTDNAPENLDWGTQEQNWRDRAAHGGGMGEAHHNAKLTHKIVAEIRASSKSQRALAAEYGVTQSSIQAAKSGAIWTPDRKPAPENMPRAACRILLEIVSVRVERLNDCSDADARAEGTPGGHGVIPSYNYNATPSEHFSHLWESINGAGSWASNPWVWVIEFKRVTP